VIKGGLHLMSLAGRDAVLAAAKRNGKIEATALYSHLLEAVGDIRPRMIGIASSANVFAGNEIERSQVQQFIGLMTRMAIVADGALVLISHPSLTGINSGSGISGSTGWHNSVRARIYLSPATTEAGEEPDKDLRQLQFLKNNYGPLAERILLRWKNGLFVPEPGPGSLEKAAADAKAEHVFLDLLNRFLKQGRNVNDKSGQAYAPAVFAQEREAKVVKIGKQALVDAMRRLFAANRIHLEIYGKPSRQFRRLVPGAAP
jgi:RecA-family ATPase